MRTNTETFDLAAFTAAVHAELVKNELEVALVGADFAAWSDEFWSGYVSGPSERIAS